MEFAVIMATDVAGVIFFIRKTPAWPPSRDEVVTRRFQVRSLEVVACGLDVQLAGTSRRYLYRALNHCDARPIASRSFSFPRCTSPRIASGVRPSRAAVSSSD